MNARPPKHLAQLRSVSHTLFSTLQSTGQNRQNWYDLTGYISETFGGDHVGGSYVVNLFKQNFVSQKKIFLLPWHHPTIFFVVDSLTIFTAQIAHSHMYWGKLCLHSLADQNVHHLEKVFSTKYRTKATWTVPCWPPGYRDQETKTFRKPEAKFRWIHLIAAVTVYFTVWHWHCTRASFTVLVSCNGEIAVRSYPLLWLPRQVAKLASGLFYGWSLLRNNNTAINLQTFTSSYCGRRFSACD